MSFVDNKWQHQPGRSQAKSAGYTPPQEQVNEAFYWKLQHQLSNGYLLLPDGSVHTSVPQLVGYEDGSVAALAIPRSYQVGEFSHITRQRHWTAYDDQQFLQLPQQWDQSQVPA